LSRSALDDGDAEAEAKVALVPGEIDVARGRKAADEELSCVEEEGEGEGEECGCGLDAWSGVTQRAHWHGLWITAASTFYSTLIHCHTLQSLLVSPGRNGNYSIVGRIKLAVKDHN
jgi:hypothetical protein